MSVGATTLRRLWTHPGISFDLSVTSQKLYAVAFYSQSDTATISHSSSSFFPFLPSFILYQERRISKCMGQTHFQKLIDMCMHAKENVSAI